MRFIGPDASGAALAVGWLAAINADNVLLEDMVDTVIPESDESLVASGNVCSPLKHTIYVSATGNDAGDGSAEYPLGTVETAMTEMKKKLQGSACEEGCQCARILLRGRFVLKETLEVWRLLHAVLGGP